MIKTENKSNSIYGLFFKDKPIHDVDFFMKDRNGELRRVSIPKKFYTKLGYARNGANNLPRFVDRQYIRIMEYEPVKELEWRAKQNESETY